MTNIEVNTMSNVEVNMTKSTSKNANTLIGQGVPFDRIRRITGYCSKFSRWNDAKKAEEHDRVKHA